MHLLNVNRNGFGGNGICPCVCVGYRNNTCLNVRCVRSHGKCRVAAFYTCIVHNYESTSTFVATAYSTHTHTRGSTAPRFTGYDKQIYCVTRARQTVCDVCVCVCASVYYVRGVVLYVSMFIVTSRRVAVFLGGALRCRTRGVPHSSALLAAAAAPNNTRWPARSCDDGLE